MYNYRTHAYCSTHHLLNSIGSIHVHSDTRCKVPLGKHCTTDLCVNGSVVHVLIYGSENRGRFRVLILPRNFWYGKHKMHVRALASHTQISRPRVLRRPYIMYILRIVFERKKIVLQ